MQTYIVLYRAPIAVLEAWMKKSPEERQSEETAMKVQWDTWMKEQGTFLKETAGTGKTKRVTKDGVVDAKNDIMLFSMVEAESPDAAAQMFENHPHLNIPEASIEIMPVNYLPSVK